MKEHDKLAKRLGIILTRLNTGERLYLEELSREFGVSERTLQRDFNERLNYLPIQREGACYFLDPKFLGRQTHNELSLLLLSMGFDTLFSGKHYLSNGILNNKTTPPFLFKNPQVENISNCAPVFEKLIEVIQRRNIISFSCEGKMYDEFMPYRLINDSGYWYIAGTQRNRLESLRVAKIRELVRYEDKYSPAPNIEQKLTSREYEDELLNPVEVLIQMSSRVIDAFFNENNNDNFQVLKDLDSGQMLISHQTKNIPQLLRQLKAWLPQVEVLSPDWVRYLLKQELQVYLDSTK
ncbi:TPA: WYL domain-containing protein [Vibrio parahaemolyticus]|uniref:helix-turn-helix transcriptional regulator n=1 Tax=Vibrio parahaemolyticus TaxID=670 RepID=UPI000A3941E5|nr:WYL domain-containing protein [Vibrio parahaemolyticus]MBY7719203.1 WYL domain-containing protein [Vibrio parahaemolyticus]MDF4661372.1 WYL domain-containing protein [Vibrio parahaemolyticus]OUJ24323.1 transcriptional regulator [Vibrio parahaemolyticus]TBT61724.1 WYL domain-containing protein [Vibrio parahaemolyticus]TOQ39276.1 transcriptional regulator [Vibrio parahaemolyticus]